MSRLVTVQLSIAGFPIGTEGACMADVTVTEVDALQPVAVLVT